VGVARATRDFFVVVEPELERPARLRPAAGSSRPSGSSSRSPALAVVVLELALELVAL
jgi:hypothetical protein